MTTTTDQAAVILDRAAAGKTLTPDEVAVLRADREQLQTLVARRSEIFRAYRDRQNTDDAEIRRLERKVRDLEAHLHYAHKAQRAHAQPRSHEHIWHEGRPCDGTCHGYPKP